MKTRFYISTEEAQKILYTQINDTLFNYFFADGCQDAELTLTEVEVLSQTEWSILKTDKDGEVTYYLDWKNKIWGLGTRFWGHEPMELECNAGFMRFPLNECASDNF